MALWNKQVNFLTTVAPLYHIRYQLMMPVNNIQCLTLGNICHRCKCMINNFSMKYNTYTSCFTKNKSFLLRRNFSFSCSNLFEMAKLTQCQKVSFLKKTRPTSMRDYSEISTQKTVSQCCTELISTFVDRQIPEAKLSAEYIIAHVLGHKTLHSVCQDKILDESQLNEIEILVQKRLSRLPIQYVLGEWDVGEHTLACRTPVFIPRPETENLINLALNDPVIQNGKRFLEIGPGSGTICLSLLKALPQIHATVVDISQDACCLTKQNSEMLGVSDRITVLHADFGEVTSADIKLDTKFDFLISNPPYIPSKDMDNLAPEIAWYEDHRALHAGDDGLDVVRIILWKATQFIQPGGSIWLEIDTSHPQQIQNMTEQSDSQVKFIGVHEDFCSRERFCHLQVT